MNNLIVVGDVHIHDYAQHNIGDPRFRLKQFIGLAHRLVRIGVEQGTKRLAIAGDTVHKPIVAPHIQHYVHEFFRILGEHYDEMYLIMGQHDQATKFQSHTIEDSFVPLMAPSAHYADQQVLEIGGRKVAFANWRGEQDWSFIKEQNDGKPVDLMIGHLTISTLFGQDYDSSLYELGLFGDIHQCTSDGNSHTTNTPIPHYRSDCQEGSVICLDLDTMKWERILTADAEFDHLRIYEEGKCPKQYLDSPLVVIEKTTKDVEAARAIYKSVDVEKVIAEVCKKLGVVDKLGEIQPLVDTTGHEPLNMAFSLVNIRINNWRSVRGFEYDFQKGIAVVVGENGAGKSSLFSALSYVLEGRTSRPPIHFGEDTMEVTLTLTYSGSEFVITRGWKDGQYLDVSIEGEPLAANSLRDKNNDLRERLPFIEFMDLLYRPQKAPGLLSSYGYQDRIRIVSSVIGLTLTDEYYKIANSEVKKKFKVMNDLETILIGSRAILAQWNETDWKPLGDDRGDTAISGMNTQIKDGTSEITDLQLSIKNGELRVRVQDEVDLLVARVQRDQAGYDGALKVEAKDWSMMERLPQVEISLKADRLSLMGAEHAKDEMSAAITKLIELKANVGTTEARLVEAESGKVSALAGAPSAEALKSKLNELLKIRDDAQREATQLGKDLHSIEMKQTLCKSELDSVRGNIASLETASCETCLQPLSAEKVAGLRSTASIREDELMAKLAVLDRDHTTYTTSRDEQNKLEGRDEEFISKLLEAGANLDRLTTVATELASTLELAKSDITAIEAKAGNPAEVEAQIVELKKSITVGEERQEILRTLSIEKANFDQAATVIAAFKERREALLLKSNELDQYPTGSLVDLQHQLNQLEVGIGRITYERDNLIAMLTDFNKFTAAEYAVNIDEINKNTSAEEHVAWVQFSKIFAPKGDVVQSVFLTVAEMMTSDELTVRTLKEKANGKDFSIDFDIDFKVGRFMIPYAELSGGQQTLVDVLFMCKLFAMSGSVGMVILDETLKELSENKLEQAAQYLAEAPIGTILFSTHVSSFPFYDSKLEVELIDNESVYRTEGG